MTERFLVGVDEVGRGPVAGPVYVCAFLAQAKDIEDIVKGIDLPLRDSKKLTEKMRNKWFKYLQDLARGKKIKYIISKCNNLEIDEKGIAVCIKACVNNSLDKLQIDVKETKVFLDGGLFAEEKYNQETLIKGDENIPVISLASIIAKVMRDEEMNKYAKEYKEYGFEKNKGYGTFSHMSAIKTKGVCPIHRVSFLKNI